MNLLGKTNGTLLSRIVLIVMLGSITVLCLGQQFGGGEGTAEDPWVINRPEHLNEIRNYLGAANADKHFLQTEDIDMGVAPWNVEPGWNGIGTNAANSFQGTYDGGEYVIRNLTILRGADQYVFGGPQGLFGFAVNATIKNVGLLDANIHSWLYTAGLVGRAQGNTVIEFCFVTGTMRGTDYVGGIVGQADNATRINNCYSMMSMSTTSGSNTHRVGGIVGYMNGGEAKWCYATGLIEPNVPTQHAGAVIGQAREAAVALTSLYWNLDTAGVDRGVGNIAGFAGHSTFHMLRRGTYTGFNFNDVWRIEEGASYPYLSWEGDPGGHVMPPPRPLNLAATAGNGVVNLSWNPPDPNIGVPDGYNVYRDDERINEEVIEQLQYQDNDVNNFVVYEYYVTSVFGEAESAPSAPVEAIPYYYDGEGTEQSPHIVETAAQLHGVRYFPDRHFLQAAHIDLGIAPWNEDEGWIQIQDFTGTYDGAHYRIENLTINRNATWQGLFHTLNGATMKRMALHNVNVTGGMLMGPLSPRANNSEIIDCYVSGTVRGTYYVGGIVGQLLDNSTLRNCYSTGSVTATENMSIVGGITADKQESDIIDSYSTMTVNGVQRDVGGLVGYHTSGNMIRSYYAGQMNLQDPQQSIGGLVGSYTAGDIVACYWNTQLSGQNESPGGGEGRTTEQMRYPYGAQTYVNWDFDEVWDHDLTRIINNGYPILHYQTFVLDTPVVEIEIVTIEEVKHVLLTWEAIENANSYVIYTSENPYAQNWGAPYAVVSGTQFSEAAVVEGKRFYYVVASIAETP